MAKKKIIYIAAASEDRRIRNMIKAEPLRTKRLFEYADPPVEETYDRQWQAQVREQIRQSTGVLVVISKNTLSSRSQAWERQCAEEERKPMKGIWAYDQDQASARNLSTMVWTWGNIANWIDEH